MRDIKGIHLKETVRNLILDAINLSFEEMPIKDADVLFGDDSVWEFDSLDAIAIITSLEAHFLIKIEENKDEFQEHFRSINDIAKHLESL